MKNIIIFEYKGLQYFYGNYISLIKKKEKLKENITIKKILFYKDKKKIYLGKPYIKNLLLKIKLFFFKKKKKKIIKFKRRKRYKIIKSFYENTYKFYIEKIKWQKRKQ